MEFVPLTESQRRSFAADGYLVVQNALDPETIDNLLVEADQLCAPFLNKPELAGKPEYNHLDLRRGLLKHETLPLVGIKVCYCLTDFEQPNCGMTLMARGTHLRTEPLQIPKGQVDPIGVEVKDLRLKAGDALFFENRIFHTAAPNLSARTSKVVIYGYAYRWMKPEVYLESPDEQQLFAVDPITRQLLGGYRDVDTPAWALDRWAKRYGVSRATVPWTVNA